MASLWKETSGFPRFDTLEKNIHTDVLIIGGGIAGILCAYYIKQAGIDCILVEEKTLCSGTTQNTTAKLTSQHGLIYHKLIKQFGGEDAQLYLQANQEALAEYRRLCNEIDCDYSVEDHYVYSTDDPSALCQELSALKTLDFPGTFATHLPIPVENVGAVRFPNQGQFHVLKFLSRIVKDLPIYEHTPVRELAPNIATCDGATIHANKIIVATHFPMLNKHGSYFLKLYQHRSYCLALENLMPMDGMFVDENNKGLSFRNHGNLLILGGGGHRTGKKGGGWAELEAFAQKHCPGARIRYRWAAQDCMSLDGVPYIGRYSRNTDGLYVATGFNKWGMTGSMVAARLLTDLIMGKTNPYEAVFSPSRSILRPQLGINAFEAVTNLLTPTTKRCPHLGCALKWNPQEHTWDCPCHGSRFQENGKRIDGPSTGDLNF